VGQVAHMEEIRKTYKIWLETWRERTTWKSYIHIDGCSFWSTHGRE